MNIEHAKKATEALMQYDRLIGSICQQIESGNTPSLKKAIMESKPEVRRTHTPGPWYVFAGTAITNKKDGCCQFLATVPESTEVAGKITFEETRANARLIAAAPDLLAALRGMLEWARRVKCDTVSHGTWPGMEVAKAITAIARAERQIERRKCDNQRPN